MNLFERESRRERKRSSARELLVAQRECKPSTADKISEISDAAERKRLDGGCFG